MTRSERQLLALKRWKEYKCRACIVGPTGIGKSRIGLVAIKKVLEKNSQAQIVIVVPTTALQKQWKEHLQNWQLSGKVIVINTAAKKQFDCDFLVLDEMHRYASDTFKLMFNNCNPAFILGLTATYERLDGKEKILEHYAPVCDTITVKEAVENSWLAPYRKYKVLLDVDLTQYNNATQTFLSSFSFFNFDWNLAMDCLANKKRQIKFAKDNGYELKQVQANVYTFNKALQFRKKFILNHPKKLEIANKILEARKDKKCITFNGSIDFCLQYNSGILMNSRQTDKENEASLEEFKKAKTGMLHTSKMADEGIDVPGLSVGIVTGFNSSKTSAIQKLGRCIRFEEGKIAEFFILVLKNTVEDKW